MADIQTSKVDAKLAQSMWNHDILYANRSSKYEQLLVRTLLKETKNTKWSADES
jgi:hypothetical protein